MTRVLIVEDSKTIATYLELEFDLAGDTITLVERNFTDLLDPQHPAWDVDAVLCDLMLPDITGWDLLAVAAEHHPHLRLVMFTAAGEDPPGRPEGFEVKVIAKGGGVPFRDLYDVVHGT